MSKGYQDLYDKLPCEFTIDDIIMLKSHCNSLIKENYAHQEHIEYLEGMIKLLETSVEGFEQENQVLKDGIKEFLKNFEIEQWEINEDNYNTKMIDFHLKQEAEHHSGFVGLISISAIEDGELYNKVKAMLEVVENEQKEEQENE